MSGMYLDSIYLGSFDVIIMISAALGECAKDKDSLVTIHQLDGVRLLWSLLKNPSERVRNCKEADVATFSPSWDTQKQVFLAS